MIGLFKIIKDYKLTVVCSSGINCISVCRSHFDAIDPGSNPPFFLKNFFLPFQISYRVGKAFIFNKNEVNNQKIENKVLGRVKVDIGRALLSQ